MREPNTKQNKKNTSRKRGGIAALLASTLAIANPVDAINLNISNTSSNNTDSSTNFGQSFINDSGGSGANIFLNDWTFAFADATNANNAISKTLSIYSGGGNGGTLLASSTNAAITNFAGFDSVRWAFTGGVSIVDNQTYTAVIQGSSGVLRKLNSDSYPNGSPFYSGSPDPSTELVFEGNFTPNPSDAINLRISNTSSNNTDSSTNFGQSFINNSNGSGVNIVLNDWLFAFADATNANNALSKTLSIYSGGGNGGTLLASSTNTAITSFAGFDSVRWTFTGGVSIVDNQTYTAVIEGSSGVLRKLNSDSYPNGSPFYSGSPDPFTELVFEGNFTPNPIPFEFEASGGVAILGGAWFFRKQLQKRKVAKE
jgi:hypothetical protein